MSTDCDTIVRERADKILTTISSKHAHVVRVSCSFSTHFANEMLMSLLCLDGSNARICEGIQLSENTQTGNW